MDHRAIAKRLTSRAAMRKLVRATPVLGTAIIVFEARRTIREKGPRRAAADLALDLAPFVGAAKAIYEAIYGDVIPARPEHPAR